MLRLQGNEVIYNNSENMRKVHLLNHIQNGFMLSLPGGTIAYIPEEDCTQSEREVFDAYRNYYSNINYAIDGLAISLSGNINDSITLEGSPGQQTLFKIWLDAEGLKYGEIIYDGIEKLPPIEGVLLLEGNVNEGRITVTGGVLHGS